MNNTKPLPTGLIHELLPDTEVQLPEKFIKKKFPISDSFLFKY